MSGLSAACQRRLFCTWRIFCSESARNKKIELTEWAYFVRRRIASVTQPAFTPVELSGSLKAQQGMGVGLCWL